VVKNTRFPLRLEMLKGLARKRARDPVERFGAYSRPAWWPLQR